MSSSSEGSSGDVAQALLQQSACVESASEQVWVLGACPKSMSGLKNKSKSASGRQTAGPKVQLAGVKKLTSPIPPLVGSQSALGKGSSGPLPFGQALDSVSTSVLGQGPVLQELAPIGRGGHEAVSSLKMHHPLSLPLRQNRPLSSPVHGHHQSSSPGDRPLPVKLAR